MAVWALRAHLPAKRPICVERLPRSDVAIDRFSSAAARARATPAPPREAMASLLRPWVGVLCVLAVATGVEGRREVGALDVSDDLEASAVEAPAAAPRARTSTRTKLFL